MAPHTTTEAAPVRRPYSSPALTVYGPASVLTQAQPASRPREEGSNLVDVHIFFRGADA